jgi:copper chaperone
MTTLTVKAPGISCGHCVRTIENEVCELPGVQKVQASEQSKLVTITYNQLASEDAIKALMAEIGYPVQPA